MNVLKTILFVATFLLVNLAQAQTRTNVLNQIGHMNRILKEVEDAVKPKESWLEDKNKEFLELAAETKQSIAKISEAEMFNDNDDGRLKALSRQYVLTLLRATQTKKVIGNVTNKAIGLINQIVEEPIEFRIFTFFSAVDTFSLVDFESMNDLEIESLLKNYRKGIIARDFQWTPRIALETLDKIEDKLKSREIDQIGFRAALSAQQAGGDISWELIKQIKTVWQLKALRQLLMQTHQRQSYLDRASQNAYVDVVTFLANSERLNIFDTLLKLERKDVRLNPDGQYYTYYFRSFHKDTELMDILENNPLAVAALSSLGDMNFLLDQMGISHREPILKFLKTISNSHQVKALQLIALVQEDILPQEVTKVDVEHYERKMPFGDKVAAILGIVDTSWSYGPRTRSHLTYGSSSKDIVTVKRLLEAVEVMTGEEDLSRFQESLTVHLKNIGVLQPRAAISCNLLFGN